MQHRLEQQADTIEAVLAVHKIPGRVWGGCVTPRHVRFDLTTARGVRVQKVLALADEIALGLGVAQVRLYRKGSVIRVEVPRRRPGVVRFSALQPHLPELPPFSAILGVDEEGLPLLLRLSSPDVAHVLVAGATGSGKTALLRTLVLSLALHNAAARLHLMLVDPKGRGFRPFAALPHLIRPVVTEAEEAVQALQGLVLQMEQRDRHRRQEPRLIAVIDELADLRMAGGRVVDEALTRLTQRGREAGIHVIVATQRPEVSVLGGLVKANLPVRLVGAVASPEDARVATGVGGSGAERLQGRGDFLLVSRGQQIRFQAAYVAPGEMSMLLQKLSKPTDLVPAPGSAAVPESATRGGRA